MILHPLAGGGEEIAQDVRHGQQRRARAPAKSRRRAVPSACRPARRFSPRPRPRGPARARRMAAASPPRPAPMTRIFLAWANARPRQDLSGRCGTYGTSRQLANAVDASCARLASAVLEIRTHEIAHASFPPRRGARAGGRCRQLRLRQPAAGAASAAGRFPRALGRIHRRVGGAAGRGILPHPGRLRAAGTARPRPAPFSQSLSRRARAEQHRPPSISFPARRAGPRRPCCWRTG